VAQRTARSQSHQLHLAQQQQQHQQQQQQQQQLAERVPVGAVHFKRAVHVATRRMQSGLSGLLSLVDVGSKRIDVSPSVQLFDEYDGPDSSASASASAHDAAGGDTVRWTTCLCWSAEDVLRRHLVDASAQLDESVASSQSPLVFRVPVDDIMSVRVCQPGTLASSPFLVVLTKSGQLPPLLLKHGGLKELMEALQAFVNFGSASSDGDLFVRQDETDDLLQRSISLFQMKRGRITITDPLHQQLAPPTRSLLHSSRDELLVHLAQANVDARYRFGAPAREELAAFRTSSLNESAQASAAASAAAAAAAAAMETELGDFDLVGDDRAAAPAPVLSPVLPRRDRAASMGDGRLLAQSSAPPLTFSELLSMCDLDGSYSELSQLRIRRCAFYSGVARDDDLEPQGDDDDPLLTFEARRALWRFLLRGSTPALSRGETQKLVVDYLRVKSQWESIQSFPDQVAQFSGFRDREQRVAKDITRTDRTLAFFRGDGDAGVGANENVDKLGRVLLTYAFW
jgi:hypothetical protein